MRTICHLAKVSLIGIFALNPLTASAADLTLVSFGGQYQDNVREAWWDPIAEKLGISFAEDTIKSPVELRAHVQSGNVVWDVVDLSGYACDQAVMEGLVEELDYNVIDPGNIRQEIVTGHYIGVLDYSLSIAYNKEKLGDNPPQSWADFWNVDEFPGTRAILNRPVFTLETALLADGVPASQLYPIDVDRAFEKLKEIEPHVSLFYASGGQGAQLVRDQEVDMLAVFTNRARDAINDGAPYEVVLNQTIVDIDCYVIPKGSKNKELAMRFIAEVVKPEMNARIADYDNLSPTNADATAFVAEERRAELTSNPDNKDKFVFLNQSWWGQNFGETTERFTAFVGQ